MLTNLQNLARYYRDVLTVLAENTGRALRSLNVGRRYGLVADLSFFQLPLSTLLDSPNINLERIVPNPEADESDFEPEPDPSTEPVEEEERAEKVDPKVSEAHALIRIWRKQRQDIFNRETLLGVGLTRASTSRKAQPLGPLICYRVRPVYDPETRKFMIEKVVETPFPNLTLLSQILTEDELSEIRQQIHSLTSGEDFDEERFHRLVRTVSGASQLLRNLRYIQGRLHSLTELSAVEERGLPVLFDGAVLLNIPRGNAYLLDDLEKLAAEGKDEELAGTAVGPILEVPSDDDPDHASRLAAQPEDPERIGHFLQEYALRCQKLSLRGTGVERWLLGDPSDRPIARIDERSSLSQRLLEPLEALGELSKESGVSALAQEIDSTGIKPVGDALHGWAEWIRSHAAEWIRRHAQAVSSNLPGCQREDLQGLAQKYRRPTLKAWRAELDEIITAVHSVEQTSIPDRYARRILDRESVAQLGDALAALTGR